MTTIDEVNTIYDATAIIRGLTGQALTEYEFLDEVVAYALPLYAVAASGRKVVRHSRDEKGRLAVAPAPGCQTPYVLLLQDEIYQLSRPGGGTITRRPAWSRGQPPYVSWEEILQFRRAYHRVIHPTDIEWGIETGEWMGQSEEYFFDQPTGVKRLDQLRAPAHTVQELVRIFARRRANEPAIDHRKYASKSEQNTLNHPLAGEGSAAEDASITEPQGSDSAPCDACSGQVPACNQGINRQQVLRAFDKLALIDLPRALSNGKGLFGDGGARVQRGSRGGRHQALYDPVILAIGYYEQYRVPRSKLNRVFTENLWLHPWLEEWREKAEDLL